MRPREKATCLVHVIGSLHYVELYESIEALLIYSNAIELLSVEPVHILGKVHRAMSRLALMFRSHWSIRPCGSLVIA